MTATTRRRVTPTGQLFVQAAGEALDTAGRSTSKAQSVALRVLLLGAGLVPTDDPDPDHDTAVRGEVYRTAVSYRDEALDMGTSLARLRQMRGELRAATRLGEMVRNEVGDDEAIGALIDRVGQERTPGRKGGAA